MKNNGLSEEVNDVLKNINAVKKTMRNKKYCFTECDSEKIRNAFVTTLMIDLSNLFYSLDRWLESGARMVANEDNCNDD